MMPTSPAATMLVISRNDNARTALLAILAGTGWTVLQVTNHAEAMELLGHQHFPVVITNGGWREILEFTSSLKRPPSVIVTAPVADEALWAEVLNLGGYDVLEQPFDATEVSRITSAALRRAKTAIAGA